MHPTGWFDWMACPFDSFDRWTDSRLFGMLAHTQAGQAKVFDNLMARHSQASAVGLLDNQTSS